jgi:hypothetical protein
VTGFGRGIFLSVLLVIGISSLYSSDGIQYDSVKIAQTLNLRFSTRYIEFHFSKAFAELDTVKGRAEAYDKFCDDVINRMDLPAPSARIRCFLYASESEMRECLGINGGGWAISGEIHTLGLFPVQHECFHVLIDGLMRQPKSPFFAEGIGQYFELTRDSQMVNRDLSIVSKFLDQPIESWAEGTKGFWDSPKEGWITVTYSISGMFVRYLIREFGLYRFKEFYRLISTDTSTPVVAGFERVYRKSLHEAVSSFSDHIRTSR